MRTYIQTPIALLMATFLGISASAQSFSDDFESYNEGDYLGASSPDWTTWSGTEGGDEDVTITTANANSGTNSLYFSSTSTSGGPQDVVLPFDQVYDSGNFTFEANFLVEEDKGAYFNLQGTLTVAEIWALDCYMNDDGTMDLSNSGTPYLSSTYPVGQWFNLRIEMDLTSNDWELFINNESQGVFSNPTGQIGILDLFPVNPNGQSGFYVDDVSYTHIPADLPAENGGVTFVQPVGGLAGQESTVAATVRNLGSDTITSFDVTVDYDGQSFTESVGPIELASLETYDHSFAGTVTLASVDLPLVVTVSNVNGLTEDGNLDDDDKTITVSPVIPAEGKMVLGEEATGTWCQWCPRGAVYMDYMAEKYPNHWAGIAVHNADPMTDVEYDTGINTIINGYPSATVDRGPDNDPNAMEQAFLQQIVLPPSATLSTGANWNPVSRELSISVSYTFIEAVSGNYKVACAISEDGVTGTGPGYNQSNAYAGGDNGEMGGYENLPSSVPAAQMVYDHVARGIAPSFEGDSDLLPSSLAADEVFTACFSFTLPEDWDENNMHIIGMLIEPDGDMNNVGYVTVTDAVSNGIAECTVGLTESILLLDGLDVYPNPASDVLTLSVQDAITGDWMLTIRDAQGRLIEESQVQGANTNNMLVDVSALDAGLYHVSLLSESAVYLKSVMIQ